MTFQDLGSLGELVGGIAVVVTVVYLAIQIRHNTRGLDQNSDLMRMSFEAPPTPHRCRPIRPTLWGVDVLRHRFTNPVEIGPVDES